MCPVQIEKAKISQITPDPSTGLTPLQKRQLRLKNTIDPETGLSLLQLKSIKSQKTLLKIDPVTGMTKLQQSHKKLAEKDPITGESKKSQQAKNVIEKMKQQIDPVTGMNRWELSRSKSRLTNSKKSLAQKQNTIAKRNESMNKMNPISGLTLREEAGRKIGQALTTPDKITGLTPAQHRAKKNLENAAWLNSSKRGRASKESLLLFDQLIEYCDTQGIDWYCGTRGKSEWWIKDDLGKVKFFDFVLLDLKIIVEYNGETWHPNPYILSEDDWQSWTIPGGTVSADEQYRRDYEKTKLAVDHGFEVITVWSSDDISRAADDIKQVIHQKYSQLTFK